MVEDEIRLLKTEAPNVHLDLRPRIAHLSAWLFLTPLLLAAKHHVFG
jgi:hypothetical protein